ncbi:MAG: sodium:proton antiporter [Myxococcales bacterium]|nr:sodium:proton antiporter [Myxococcales bacterium]MCB9522906.1 sodium:proton antiporter [Myxococcales bacterium]
MASPANDPALTLGIALGAGMLAQVIARHLRLPGIVILLAMGVLLGPEVAGLIQPSALGNGLRILVGFAVAVILFEGGLNLELKHLKRQAKSIRQLVTWGALVTAIGGTVTPMLLLDWAWQPSLLFGTLVIVTGPTVVTPLLRRIRVKPRVATVLEAEGVFGDAIGAILAVVALEWVVSGAAAQGVAHGLWTVAKTLGVGIAVGGVGGLLLALLLRIEGLIPEGLENVTILTLVLALYQFADHLVHEAGIAAAIAAGLVVGNLPSRVSGELKEFKEQLTVMAIGMLFVLLAADVGLDRVLGLGWAGVATVGVLMLVVRPLNILAGTHGTDLTRNERLFMAWLAPRGIVAAAVASLFAQELTDAGVPGGTELQALVFLVIAVTVVLQGLTGGFIAQALGISRPRDNGWVLLGANALARQVGQALRTGDQEVVLLDSNVDAVAAAEADGFRVLFGSGLSESVLMRAEVGARRGALAVTPNDSANVLFVRRGRRHYKVPRAWAAISPGARVDLDTLSDCGGRWLFGAEADIDWWIVRVERGQAVAERRVRERVVDEEVAPLDGLLFLAIGKSGKASRPFDDESRIKAGEQVWMLVDDQRREAVEAWLAGQGFGPPLTGANPTEKPQRKAPPTLS